MKYLALGKRLKKFRELKGLSPEALAEQAGISASELENYEQDQEIPKIATLIKLSRCLDVNVAEIFRDRPDGGPYEIVRKMDRQRVSPLFEPNKSKIKDYAYELLTLPGDSKHLDAYLIEVPPNQGKKPYDDLTHPGEEFFFVLEGKVCGEFDGEKVELDEGDSIYFRSQVPHCLYNPFDQLARALVVIYPF